ncbi:acyltransferase family protein [Falsibacillus pallidus]|uniref:Fucose 4-O-acetylase-like acetyltransferase n=1 Tax=Falsibacillus pallidus TaxID=493781 RepID=A0A370GWQ5_9BACI|nr:acyltransferase family protein [Falsibacillus pallidus]RDI47690.1 fucose 4-O-acetylase-like acetyltransferase [Falsibacillus pallidus]
MEKRDYYFDNAKFILILFVVFGHLIQSYIDKNSIIEAVYKFIYTFHMPAFILVSGYFAKGFYNKGYIWKLTKKLILPYLIFQTIYTVFYYYLYDKSTFAVDPLNPQWALWFLLSLFCWNLLLLAFAKLKPIPSLALAFAIGLLVGYFDWISNYLSLSRTFVFFPLFLLGYFMDRKTFSRLTETKSKIFTSVIILTVLVSMYLFPDWNEKWLLGSKPYDVLGAEVPYSALLRAGVYILNIVMVLCFFSYVPDKKYFFTKWGKNTLYVYLLHGFLIKTFRESDVSNHYSFDIGTYVILALVSFMLSILLSSKFITSLTQPVIELRANKWKKFKERFKVGFLHLKRMLGN